MLAEYAKWELSLPRSGVTVVELHSILNDYLKAQRAKNPAFKFSGDGIHPDAAGHLLMARTIVSALGVKVDGGDLHEELSKLGADPLFNLVNRHRQVRSAAWLAYVGYTRGKTVKADSIETEEQNAAVLQAQIDEVRRKP